VLEKRSRLRPFVLAVAIPAAMSCLLSVTCSETDGSPNLMDGGDDSDTGSNDLESISIEPGDVTLTVVDGVAVEQVFTVSGELEDGTVVDLTEQADFGLTATGVGQVDGPVFTSSDRFGGETTLTAEVDGLVAEADITVLIETSVFGDGVPTDAGGLFGGTDDPARAPAVTYPADGVLLPPNLADIAFQWDPGTGNDIWRVRFEGQFMTVDVYLAQDTYVPADLAWSQLIPGNGGMDPVKVTVSGTSQADPSTVGSSAPIEYSVAEEAVEGGVYYWAASSTVAADYGIFRFDFGEPGVPAGQAFTTVQTEGRCVACHALSHDGELMALNYDGGDGPADIISVSDQATVVDPANAYYANFQTYSPDDEYLLTVYQGVFTLREGATGAAIENLPLSYVTYPDWSLDGGTVAFTRCTRPLEGYSDWTFKGGQIEVMTCDGPGGWGTPEVLVPAEVADVNYYYPAISPDGAWVIYNRSTESTGLAGAGDSYSDDDATLRVVGMDGDNDIAMDAVNLTGYLRTSWAKWCPHVYEYKGAPVMWFTFSSMRRYGNLLADGQNPQLWMSAFSPARAADGEDPSWPAFYLPFQDITTNNHIAQWTEVVVEIQ